jgi:hypothetical protein
MRKQHNELLACTSLVVEPGDGEAASVTLVTEMHTYKIVRTCPSAAPGLGMEKVDILVNGESILGELATANATKDKLAHARAELAAMVASYDAQGDRYRKSIAEIRKANAPAARIAGFLRDIADRVSS